MKDFWAVWIRYVQGLFPLCELRVEIYNIRGVSFIRKIS